MKRIFLKSIVRVALMPLLFTVTASAQVPEPARVLSNYIQHASVTGNEQAAGVYLSEQCRERGLHLRVFTFEEGRYNFAASLYPLSLNKPNIVFMHHIDVVSPGDTTKWKYPPFSGMITDSFVWGRGSIDFKGTGVMQLFAISEFVALAKRKDLPYNITMLAVSSEETGGDSGAAIIAERYLAELNAVVMFGEGGAGISGVLASDPGRKVFGITVAQKRALWLQLRLKTETSGHGSVTPEFYVNRAMVAAINNVLLMKQPVVFCEPAILMFRELGKIEKGIKGMALRHIKTFRPLVVPKLKRDPLLMSLVSNTVTLTNIANPPGPHNLISQEVTAVLDCRLLPGTDTEDFIKGIKRELHNDDIEVKVISETIKADWNRPDSMYHRFSAAILEIYKGAAVLPILFPAYNDNNYFMAKGVPSFGVNPIYLDMAQVSSIHNINERTSIHYLEEGIKTYRAFLSALLL
jgi:carboxypeptidase PM20D1